MPRISSVRTAALQLCALATFAPCALGQSGARIALSGSGGVATDQRGVRSSALSVAPSVTVASGGASLQLDGNATRFATETWSLGGGAALAGRHAVGRFAALTLNASANASRLQGGGAGVASFTQLDVMPAVELTSGRFTAFGGLRAASGVASERVRQGFPLGPATSDARVSRTGAGPLFGALLTLSDAMRISAREDRLSVDGIDVTDRTFGVAVRRDRLSVAASAGVRRASDERASHGSATVSLALSPSASLEVGAGRYPRNRLLGAPGGDYLSVGLSLRTGVEPKSPLPDTHARPAMRGVTRLTIRAPDAHRVEVAGDFNDWRPAPATRAANGMWYVDLRIPAGQYRYAFRVNGSEWRVPDGATAVEDGFGGKSAWVTVSDTTPR